MAVHPETRYRYITRDRSIWGGRPIVAGTRVAVQTIVGYYKLGMSPEEILEGLPQITAAHLYEALSYYHDHEAEVERDIEQGGIADLVERYGLILAESGEVILPELGG